MGTLNLRMKLGYRVLLFVAIFGIFIVCCWESNFYQLSSTGHNSYKIILKSDNITTFDKSIEESPLPTDPQRYTTELVTTSQHQTKLDEVPPLTVASTISTPKRRYFLSVHLDGNGPNVQYGAYRAGLAFALSTDRVIVEPLFFAHWEQEKGTGKVKYLNETFDRQVLEQIVTIVSLEEFRRECNLTVEILVVDPNSILDLESYKSRSKMYTHYFNINLPKYEDLLRDSKEIRHVLHNTSAITCLGVWEPSFWKTGLPYGDDLLQTVDRHMIYTPHVRNIGEKLAKTICNGEPYLALHWRNRTGEKCHDPNKPCERSAEHMANIRKTALVAAKDLQVFMSRQNISCVYVAHPDFAKIMVEFLKDANISQVISKTDITPPKYPDFDDVRHDAYIWSLVEEEVCRRSKIFVGMRHSSWSKQVYRIRVAAGMEGNENLQDIISWKAEDVDL